MKYGIDVHIEVDTAVNKVVINSRGREKRIALVPVNRRSPDAYTVINDVPGVQVKTATDLLRWIVQNLYSKQEIKELVKQGQPDFDP